MTWVQSTELWLCSFTNSFAVKSSLIRDFSQALSVPPNWWSGHQERTEGRGGQRPSVLVTVWS